MYNEGNLIVDVIATSTGYRLSRSAQDLYIAYEVIRRHVDSTGARHFAQLTSAKLTHNGYEFTFDNGDVFTASSADAYPSALAVSDAYSKMFSGAFSVTTALTEQYNEPYARASVTGRFPKDNSYRVTVDGEAYVVPCHTFFTVVNSSTKVCEYLGDLSYMTDSIASGLTHEDPDVPFLIVSDLNDENSIDVFTDEAGSHTILIEKSVEGGQFSPVEFIVTSSTYSGISIGTNKLTNSRETVAIGAANTISAGMSHAVGMRNTISADECNAFGRQNDISGIKSEAFGDINTISAQFSFAYGSTNTIDGSQANCAYGYSNNISAGKQNFAFGISNAVSSGNYGFAFGRANTVSGTNGYAVGRQNTVSGSADATAIGGSNEVSGKSAIAVGKGCIANHLSQIAVGSYNVADTSAAEATEQGNFLEIVGNGADADNRSNARTLDWSGNECLAGSLTLGKGTADEVTITAAQLAALLATL